MRRLVPVVWALLSAAAPLAAQSDRVSVALGLDAPDPRTGTRKPFVYLRNLLADTRWADYLDKSLPIIVTHHLEIWRSRDGWIDALTSEFGWQVIVTKEPLQEEYSITVVYGASPQRPVRFAVRDSAIAYLQRPNLIEVAPPRSGRFYYSLTTRITALSDADMDQLNRFLAGNPDLDVSDRSGTILGRTFRRLLLRLAGLPSEVMGARSESFEVRRDDEES